MLSEMQSKVPTATTRPRTRVRPGICVWLAVILSVIALLFIAISYGLTYNAVQARLAELYGDQRAARYFTPAIFASAMERFRLGAGLVVGLAMGIAAARVRIARYLDLAWGALVLGIGHARRERVPHSWVRATGLAVITLIALLVRLRFLNQPIRYDEADTILSYASKPLYLGLSVYNEPNNHVFHTLLVHFAILLAGTAEWAVRLPALIAGVLLCPLSYAMARRLAGGTAALCTASLIASSSVLIEYSTNARGYTLLCCATVALIIAADESLRRASPLWLSGLVLATFLGLWTIPIFLIPFGGVILWLLWEACRRHRYFKHIFNLRLLIATLGAGLITFSAYLPVAAVTGLGSLLIKQKYGVKSTFHGFWTANLIRLHETWNMWTRDMPGWLPLAFALAFFAGLAIFPTLRRLVISLVAFTLLLFAVRRFVPFARTWLIYLPVFYAGASAAVCAPVDRLLRNPRRDLFATIAAVILAIVLATVVMRTESPLASTETGVLKSAQQIAAFLIAEHIPPDRVFRSSTSDMPIEYYWWRQTGTRPAIAKLRGLREQGIHDGWILLNGAYAERLESFSLKNGLQNVTILERKGFDQASLLHISWTP
jgi:hypothetical protein